MDPRVTGLDAFLAAGDLARHGQDLDPLEMFTSWHLSPFSGV
jgi:hypothetical protein